MSKLEFKPLVTNDPEHFILGSNHLRAMIAFIRNSPDAGPKVLQYMISFERYLDNLSADQRAKGESNIETNDTLRNQSNSRSKR